MRRAAFPLRDPFMAPAVTINLFMLALILCWPLALPINRLVTGWVRGLIDEAERGAS